MRISLFFSLLIIIGCSVEKKETEKVDNDEINLRFARKFTLTHSQVNTLEPWPGANKSISYPIGTPPKRVICTSTTHLPFLELLGVENTLVGFPGTQYISSENIRKLIEKGEILDVGGDGNLNIEMIVGLSPDIVFAFDMGNESTVLDKLEESGITVVYNSDYLEPTTLGRAEWIKFFGAFYQKEKIADSIFNAIEAKYQKLQQLVTREASKPKIVSGVVYGDTWFLPGGKNWSAQFFGDAGGNYFLSENQKTGWQELDFEYVFEEAQDADYWIGVASFQSLQELQNQDNRYTEFKAFKNRNVYNYSKNIGAEGGYDIFESGYARPDLVLSDMIKILHPELLPHYETYYFEQLP